MANHADARSLGIRPTDDLLLDSERGGDDGFLQWIDNVNMVAIVFFEGIWDGNAFSDIDMWAAFCDGILPEDYVQNIIVPILMTDFSEDMVLETVTNNMIWGSYR